MAPHPPPSAQDGARKLLGIFVDDDDADDAITPNTVLLETADEGRIFGHIYDPPSILESLVTVATTEENVGLPSLPPSVAVHSEEYTCTPFLDLLSSSSPPPQNKEWRQIPVQIRNSSGKTVRIRWIDAHYGIQSSHTWNIRPRSSSSASKSSVNNDDEENDPKWTQYCGPGHLFLLSIVKADNEAAAVSQDEEEEDLFSAYDHDWVSPNSQQEIVLGAYRPLRPLPSGSHHVIVIREEEDEPSPPSTQLQQQQQQPERVYVLESRISDPYDALCVAAASLDSHTVGGASTGTTATTIKLLMTIVSNLVKYPNEEKYQQLRLSNPKIQTHLLQSWGAIQCLTLCGFERRRRSFLLSSDQNADDADAAKGKNDDSLETSTEQDEQDEYLMIPSSSAENGNGMTSEERASLRETQEQALKLLQILSSRSMSGFVPDLAPPTPWERPRPVLGSNGTGGRNKRWAETDRRGFVSADERWARAERVNRNRRNGRGRRPDPGNAPSSRGNWGR